ncbi:protein FAR-RED ELONGATED HYPOCOTYL 3-like [Cucumis melo var. makuwa]|uniref:Protein FAR-RED ELONGATED HYPOCOTYL 3-like n=1 Tax=Cucumis melo var. makuwa TaxID=1194695 RepID=A0A5A7TJH7_CUCMM|nr:protein FAR-RED ELONGATED HYPOCOTYL 3-like [Cucumis melo var. makuwa]
MILQCAIENCKWSLRASCCIHGDRSSWVLTRTKISLAGSELSTPKVIVHFIRAGHCLSISYQKAWCAREAVLNDIRKSSVESYKMLPRFAYILELNNPSILAIYICSVVEYKVDVDSRFHYFFMILSVFTSGWQHCRPVISIDGTSMENKYGGTLLSASTSNVNDQIFHLAFCVVDYENNSSWTWFCNQLKRIIDGRNKVVMVSDRHKSIFKAIELELESIGFAKWSRAYSPRRRYNVMTTNISESLNSAMPKARELPICLMLEGVSKFVVALSLGG